MIAMDTNALIRLLVEDDPAQAIKVQQLLTAKEREGKPVVLLTEVLLESVWVLESNYGCERSEIFDVVSSLLAIRTFYLPDREPLRAALARYRDGGDFADHLIIAMARHHRAAGLFSFDKKLQRRYPDFVFSEVTP